MMFQHVPTPYFPSQGVTLDSPSSCFENFISEFSVIQCEGVGSACQQTSVAASSVGVWLPIESGDNGLVASLENTSRCIVCRKQ